MGRQSGARDVTPRTRRRLVQWYDANGRRWCSGHGEYLELHDPAAKDGLAFGPQHRPGSPPDGLDTLCRACRRYLSQRAYRQRRDQIIARNAAYKKDPRHRKVVRAINRRAMRVWRLAHKLADEWRQEIREEEESA